MMITKFSMVYSSLISPRFIRYVLVGSALNIFGFLIYLGVTWLGVEPKLAVTILYPMSVLYGYIAHKRITFRHSGKFMDFWLLGRYVFLYLMGYMLNIFFLYVLHDKLGYSHQWVQAFAILGVAGFLFIALNIFLFKDEVAEL